MPLTASSIVLSEVIYFQASNRREVLPALNSRHLTPRYSVSIEMKESSQEIVSQAVKRGTIYANNHNKGNNHDRKNTGT